MSKSTHEISGKPTEIPRDPGQRERTVVTRSINSFRTAEIENFQKIEMEISQTFSAIFSATRNAKWVKFGLIRKLSFCSFILACQNFE